ncbi:MAG: ABC transporter ATP-binding protein [Deltaproteobacteria bacterium]|nr:ABC transporter ATP-binding protein [Deltaproteobacteria bacterium]RLA87643.1 MAG: ABC transporter ATP-binding protein [Deltaproteobacteria bacterium]
MKILQVNNLVKRFEGVVANNNITFSIEENEIVGLIGPNGAGKTTLFNCIAGYHKPDKGKIFFNGKDITGWPPYQTNVEGIARTFQVIESGGDMSVKEEIMVGGFCRTSNRYLAMKEAVEIIEFMKLQDVQDMKLTELPVAQQKRVGLARALATKPQLFMLDEVAAGLTPSEIEEMKELIVNIQKKWNLTIFIIEHVMQLVMGISARVIVLDGGVKIAEGTPDEVAHNEEVIKAYLGERYAKVRKG